MYDFNLRAKPSKDKEAKAIVRRLYELGWDCMAWNTEASGRINAQNSRPFVGVEVDQLPQSRSIRILNLASVELPSSKRNRIGNPNRIHVHDEIVQTKSSDCLTTPLRQLSRLTVTVDDLADANLLTVNNPILKPFDIVAARPGNSKVFTYLCKSADIDIISLDFTHRLPFPLNKKVIDEAVKRNLYFEITYSAVLGESATPRRETFSNTRLLLQYLRGRNVILSSGADSSKKLRGGMDVCNIGEVLGLNREQALSAVGMSCAAVLRHAIARRLRFIPVEIVTSDEFMKRCLDLTSLCAVMCWINLCHSSLIIRFICMTGFNSISLSN